MGKATVITSGKGGAGKTATAANLGAALALRGKSVLLIDADTGLRNLDIALGLDGGIVYDLSDVVNGECDFKKAVLRHRSIDGLNLLPASQAGDKAAVTKTQMKNLLRGLRPEYDFIFIDCPAGIGQGFETACAGADSAIIVTTPEAGAVRNADRVIGLLEKQELTDMSLVINRMRPALIKKGLMPDTEDILNCLSVNLLGVVAEDEKIVIAANNFSLAAQDEKSDAGRAYRNMAARLCGEKVPLVNFKEKKSFFKKLFE